VRKANSNIQVLLNKVAKYEFERQGERDGAGSNDIGIKPEDIRKLKALGGRESYASNKGSEDEMKEAI
jgi:hypothetical protein